MMNYRKENPITARSKKWIAESLVGLMKSKPYEDITIKEIAVNADLVRQTVYRNFKSKDAILEYYVENFYYKFLNVIYTIDDLTLYDLMVTYFEYWYEQKEFLKLLIENNVYGKMLDLHVKYLDVLGNDPKVSKIVAVPSNIDSNYLLNFSVGGLWFTVQKWIENDTGVPPKEMAKIVLNFYHIRGLNVKKMINKANDQ